jgi:hypothetical protein
MSHWKPIYDQQKKSPNQVKVRLSDDDFDWLYRQSDDGNMSGAVRNLIAIVRRLNIDNNHNP